MENQEIITVNPIDYDATWFNATNELGCMVYGMDANDWTFEQALRNLENQK